MTCPKPHVLDASDQVLGGDAEVLKKQFAGVQASVAQLVEVAPHLESGAAVLFDDEGGEAAVLDGRVRIGSGQQAERVAGFGVGDEHLGAVDDVFLAVLDRASLQGAYVAAAPRLSQRQPAANFTAGEARQETLLLFRRAVVSQDVGEDMVSAQRPGQRHVSLANLFEYHREGGVVQPHPAKLLGDVDAEQAQLLHLVDEIVGHGVVGVMFGGDRFDLLAYEIAHHADDL